MAFWGTEVKPGKPFTHPPLNGRLHLSQATLGMGDGVQKSIVQCNVGNRMPVFLCSLFPDKAECCQLNLEFDESDEVVFSVIGPRTVHLTGYYLFSTSIHHHNDESESYGEDIAETETEKSKNSKDSEYGGSFIDDEDDDLQVFSSEDFSAGPGSNEEMPHFKFKGHKGKNRKLRKKYQISESESSQQKDFAGGVASMELVDGETEDTLPISSLFSGKRASNSGNDDTEAKARNETDNHNNNETEYDATMLEGINGVQPECKSGIRNGDKLGELVKEERPEADHCMTEEVILEQNDQNQKLASNEKCKSDDLLLTSSQVSTEGGAKLNRKRKKHLQKKVLEDDDTKDDEVPKTGSNLNSVIEDVLVEDKETQNQVNDDNHSKKRKKKKRCKDKAEGDATEMEPPVLSDHEKERSVVETKDKNIVVETEDKDTVVETKDKNTNDKEIQLSNGIIIEELETGKPDGKIASLGKKVRVHYTVKLKDSGELIDSSADKALLKIHLGEGEVQELWNVGLDGMRVGGKRRLTVPPSVSYKKEGTSENVPPNSWLVFDVELVKVR
ncbi:hypothetical protein V6N13_116016 [Hibiscus sabdariffa]|uniref:peptidylprolyl isomerase n=1 Tax=Hibiscus sabdariffa TaxID=183260 RepID=A0ABR2QSN7_9ROSI